MDEILQILSQNKLAALAFGTVVGLYIAGEIEERQDSVKIASVASDGMTVDEEIAFHESRLIVLRLLKEEKLSMDDLFLKMKNTIEELQSQLEAENA